MHEGDVAIFFQFMELSGHFEKGDERIGKINIPKKISDDVLAERKVALVIYKRMSIYSIYNERRHI